ncbi:hypothetical protein AK830_g12598 [Neonectria ditissima]|uniref:Uncharacterized protein n=1 Tax=Neonectria ditissima TaxID=78410 RepID=A0A0P7AAI2_9HYPO|nr:hypothetical protein AK830_g12598 [Neonectria ditissima]
MDHVHETSRFVADNKSDLIREVLNAIWTEAAHFDHPRWSSSYRHESPFYLEYQRETIRLIREADNQILSGALGGKLLVHAARSMSLDTVKLLVESGAPIDYSTSSKHPLDIVGRLSPLCESVRSGSVNVLKYLIDKGANVNARFPKAGRSDVQLSALTEAVSAKNLEMVKVLLEAGSEVFDDQIVGREAIYQFAKRTSMAVYQLLQESLELGLASGAASNSTLLVEAAEMGNTSLSRFLMKHGIVRQEILEAGLCHAAEMGDVGAVRTLLHRGIDPNALRYRQTLLYKERTGDPIHGLYENANGDTDQESDKDLDNKVEYDHPLWLAFDR